MKIGYNEATGMNCSTLEKDLVLCEEVGFDYIEIRLDMLRKYLESHTVEDLKAFFATSRIKPHAFNALYVYPEMFSENDDLEKRRSVLQDFELGCKVGSEIGSEYFIIVPPLQRDPEGGAFVGTSEETYKNCVRILTRLSELAEPYKMKLCFELVGFERSSVRTVEAADRIVRAVDKENVGFVFDSYNLYLNGGLNHFEALQKVQSEKIFAIHINNADDVKPQDRGQDKRRFCDQGVVDVDLFLTEVKNTGYSGMVSIETFRPEYWGMEPEEVIAEAYKTTKECLQKNDCLK